MAKTVDISPLRTQANFYNTQLLSIRAVQFTGQNHMSITSWMLDISTNKHLGRNLYINPHPDLSITTLEGHLFCEKGDYMVFSGNKFFTMKQDFFESLFDIKGAQPCKTYIY